MTKTDKITRFLNLAIALASVFFLVYLIWYDINPKGIRDISHAIDKHHTLVNGPVPVDRLQTSEDYWEIFIDPVYFDLYIPRLYQRINFSLLMKNPGQPVVELGGLGSDQGWQITLKPGINDFIDNLNLDCQDFSEVQICAGKKVLPADLTAWDEILLLYPDAVYSTYFFADQKLANHQVINWDNKFTNSDFDFLLTTYRKPVVLSEGWRLVQATFYPNELWLAGHIYKFVISAPNLAESGGRVLIRRVDFSLVKEPITLNNLGIKLTRFWQRFKNKW